MPLLTLQRLTTRTIQVEPCRDEVHVKFAAHPLVDLTPTEARSLAAMLAAAADEAEGKFRRAPAARENGT